MNVTPLLEAWAGTDVDDVSLFDGHAGTTYAFRAGGERLVLKLAPLGVRPSPRTDPRRTVPILEAMAEAGVRVPAVRAYGRDPFPVPYLIVEHVAGAPPGDVFTGPLTATAAEIDQAIAELVRIHTSRPPTAWSAVRTPVDEIDHWVPTLRKAQDGALIERALHLRERLVETAPRRARSGVTHGDFYSNNWLFDDGRLTAVLDWDSSALGTQLLDVGWLCMIYDRGSWGPSRPMDGSPEPEWLLARYEAHAGRGVEHPEWYRAAAAFRLVALTGLYLRLHRTGRRVDPVWEVFGEACPHLLGRAEELLRGA